jgi:Domain of unknown function (DUF6602)
VISTVVGILASFAAEERKKLAAYKLHHGPTIGTMYEGLSRTILDRAVPKQLGLNVVEGFVYSGEKLSGQIDCMLVRGDGERIPHTDKYKWPVKDVIAVFEVKKTLTATDLVDSYFHLRGVTQLYSEYIQGGQDKDARFDLSWARRVFAQLTGIAAPPHDRVQELPFDKEMIYHTLVMELLSPIRIVVGYHGWKKERTLREHVVRMLQSRLDNSSGLGAGSFPQLIISGDFSLVKANGFPYTPNLIDDMWPFLLSGRANPVLLMLELIWSRLDFLYKLGGLWDDDLVQESLNPFLLAKAVMKGERAGWEYRYENMSERALKMGGSESQWTPAELTSAQAVVVDSLCRGNEVTVTDLSFRKFVLEEGKSVDEFVTELINTRLVARAGDRLVLTTVRCEVVVTPKGVFAADNSTGLLTKWLEKETGKSRSDWKVLVVRNVREGDEGQVLQGKRKGSDPNPND